MTIGVPAAVEAAGSVIPIWMGPRPSWLRIDDGDSRPVLDGTVVVAPVEVVGADGCVAGAEGGAADAPAEMWLDGVLSDENAPSAIATTAALATTPTATRMASVFLFIAGLSEVWWLSARGIATRVADHFHGIA
jgi:hypothetical protein